MKEHKVTVPFLLQMKERHEKIVALTCYDFRMAQLLNAASVDVLLVGDSLGMVKLGYDSTLPVTLEDMIYHTRSVARGNTRALIVADMPFLSYQVSVSEAIRSAGRLVKEGNAHAVKVEGGERSLEVVRALVQAQIPVMGHLGLTPQSVNVMGGYKVQGRESKVAQTILKEAKQLEAAGAFSIVLECIPMALAKSISKTLHIPTIGIGAGPSCDGQILVTDDLLGLTAGPHPRFVQRYADLSNDIQVAVESYANHVRQNKFPDTDHAYS